MPLDQPPSPIENFAPALPDPAEDVRKSAIFGLQMQQAGEQQARQQGWQQDVASVGQNPTPQQIAGLMLRYPEQAAPLKQAHDVLDPAEQRARLSQLSQIHAALMSDAPDIALDKVNTMAEAYDNSNRPQDAQDVRGIGQLIQTNIPLAKVATGSYIAAQDPKKYAETFGSLMGLPSKQAKDAADAKVAQDVAANSGPNQWAIAQKNVADAKAAQATAATADQKAQADLQAAMAKAALDRLTTLNAPAKQAAELAGLNATTDSTRATTTKTNALLPGEVAQQKATLAGTEAGTAKTLVDAAALPPEAAQQYNAELKNITDLRAVSAKASDLGDAFKANEKDMSSGLSAYIGGKWKALWGNEDKITELRQQYQQVANQSILAQLKGAGRITEREIELIKAGVPDANAKPSLIQDSLKALKKATDLQIETSRDNLQWIGKNRGPGPATKPFIFNGRQIKVGEDPPWASGSVAAEPAPAAPKPAHTMTKAERAAEMAALAARGAK